jgi:hypothetical protein
VQIFYSILLTFEGAENKALPSKLLSVTYKNVVYMKRSLYAVTANVCMNIYIALYNNLMKAIVIRLIYWFIAAFIMLIILFLTVASLNITDTSVLKV